MEESGARFVQAFYAWYLPSALRGVGWPRIAVDSAHLFTEDLGSALAADAAAQAQNPDFIVGLDGDPFLNAQDPCDAYQVGKVRQAAEILLVDVHGDCTGGLTAPPHVVVELRPTAGGWVFQNFQYPNGRADLLTYLTELRQAREGIR